MNWHYHCPQCGNAREVAWDEITHEVVCPDCKAAHYAPTPGQDHSAFFGGETWPPELEEEVLAVHGSACAVPGCYREHATLVPRVPYLKGGRSSVDNLRPACREHAAARGQGEYSEWLARFAAQSADIAAANITITVTEPDALPAQTFGQLVSIQPVAGQVSFPGPFPPGTSLVFAAPFVPGPATRLVLYYEWKLSPGESCRVILGAWPRTDQPALSKGFGGVKGLTTNDHHATSERESSALLEMVLPDSRDGLWVAAVWVETTVRRPVITSYYLAAAVDQPETDAF
jgi:hypothetical protein